jgi:UTP--glucose-1-phosphate uridylyltransferase
MANLCKHYRSSIVAVEKIAPEQIKSYGVVKGTAAGVRLTKMSQIVEKPDPQDAPSDQGVVGRYVFTSSIFKHLDKLQPGAGGEYQLTDAIQSMLQEEAVYAYAYEGVRYDCGSKIGFLKATVEFALRHPETGVEFSEYLHHLKR